MYGHLLKKGKSERKENATILLTAGKECWICSATKMFRQFSLVWGMLRRRSRCVQIFPSKSVGVKKNSFFMFLYHKVKFTLSGK